MSAELFYIVSLKHTSKGDTALTLWRPNGQGYTWHQQSAGVYTSEDIKKYTDDENVAVSKAVADKYFIEGNDFGDRYVALPNDLTVRYHLNLSDKMMNASKYATCRMRFLK